MSQASGITVRLRKVQDFNLCLTEVSCFLLLLLQLLFLLLFLFKPACYFVSWGSQIYCSTASPSQVLILYPCIISLSLITVNFINLLFIFLIICICILSDSISLHYIHACDQWRSKERIISPRNRVTDSCEPLCGLGNGNQYCVKVTSTDNHQAISPTPVYFFKGATFFFCREKNMFQEIKEMESGECLFRNVNVIKSVEHYEGVKCG